MHMEKTKVKMSVPYFQVPNDIFDLDIKVRDSGLQRKLRTSEKLVYIYLCRCSNQGSNAFPSYKTIGDKCGISRRKAIDAIKLLLKNRLLIKQVRPKDNKDNETNTYEVITPSATIALGASEMIAPPSATIAPNKEPLYEELVSFKEEQSSYITLTSDGETFLETYLLMHEDILKKSHARVTREQKKYIENCIIKLKDNDITFNTWRKEIFDYLYDLPRRNNGNILAFLKASKRLFDVNLDTA